MAMKPRDVEFDALGQIARSSDRTKIVRYLRRHPGTYFAAIVAGSGVNGGSLSKHLSELEKQGIVVADLSRSERRGRAARWSIDDERLRALLRRFQDELLG